MSTGINTEGGGKRRPFWVDAVILALAFGVFVTMVRLGNWQMDRLSWKLDLIEQVETRAFGPPVAAPIKGAAPEYQRVTMQGVFRHDLSLRIKAVTEIGPGSWVMTPIEGAEQTVWVNRGFVRPQMGLDEINRPEGLQEITGLIRSDQPGGTLLEQNLPDRDRWVSADLALMSADRGIEAAGYYIDAAHQGAAADWPRGGMTQLDFRNTHLSYALTWYAMALLFFGAMAYVIWDRLRAPKERTS